MRSDQKPVILLVSPPGEDARLGDALAAVGFGVTVAHDGDQALGRFAEGSVHVVLIDGEMPADQDYASGYDICEKLQALPGGVGTPMVVIDHGRDPEASARCQAAGATDIVVAPIDIQALAHRLRYYVRAARAFHDADERARRLLTAQRLAHLAQWELVLATGEFRWATDATSVFGIPVDEDTTADALLRWVHPRDRRRVENALAEPCSHEIEFRLLTADHRELTVHQEAAIVLDDLDGTIRLIGVAQDISDLRRAERQVHELAYFDSLTGLPNRVFLRRFLSHALANASRHDQPLGVLALDLDLFKRVNDTLGHAAGDALLEEVARRIESCIRGSDAAIRPLRPLEPEELGAEVASRLGGDEFVVVLTQLSRAEDAALVAARINQRLAEPYDLAGQQVFVSSSIGIALFPENGTDPDALLDCADAAMYHAKENGRNSFRFFSAELQDSVRRRMDLDTRLRAILSATDAGGPPSSAGELILHYQPKLQLPDLAVTGVEALVRWRRPDGTMIPPGDFIPSAEDSGLIVPLGKWVLRSACRQAVEWRKSGRPLAIAVNVSARQLRQPDFARTVVWILEETGLPPRLLEIEVTEATAMSDEAAGEALHDLKRVGVRITLDDFGTGYSSLSWLARLPIDTVKIDRSFTRALGNGGKSEAITVTIAELAHRLGISLVAEGVETQSQLERLRALGHIEVQGFLFARPMPSDDLVKWLAHRRPTNTSRPVYLIATGP